VRVGSVDVELATTTDRRTLAVALALLNAPRLWSDLKLRVVADCALLPSHAGGMMRGDDHTMLIRTTGFPSAWDLAVAIGHETGHAVDQQRLEDHERDTFMAAMGCTGPWRTGRQVDDPSELFADCFSLIACGHPWKRRSRSTQWQTMLATVQQARRKVSDPRVAQVFAIHCAG
jgi:hypothetical protein